MSEPAVTVTTFLILKDGVSPEDASSPAARSMNEAFRLVAAQKGYLRQYWGTKVEDPKTIVWSTDWENVQAHKDFLASEQYRTYTVQLFEIFDLENVKPVIIHANLAADPVAAREAGITEVLSFYVPADAPDEKKSALEDNFLNILKVCLTKGKCENYGWGWVIEEQGHPDAPNAKALLFNGMLGWPSIEDHMAARDLPEFQKATVPMRSVVLPPKGGPPAYYHVKFQAVK